MNCAIFSIFNFGQNSSMVLSVFSHLSERLNSSLDLKPSTFARAMFTNQDQKLSMCMM